MVVEIFKDDVPVGPFNDTSLEAEHLVLASDLHVVGRVIRAPFEGKTQRSLEHGRDMECSETAVRRARPVSATVEVNCLLNGPVPAGRVSSGDGHSKGSADENRQDGGVE